jgi:hypothetical protein
VPTFIDDFWDDLRSLITSACPEVTSIWRVTQVERVNWQQMVEAGTLIPPYAVVVLPILPQQPSRGAGNVVFVASPTIYYIAKNAGPDIGMDIEARLVAMLMKLLGTAYRWTIVENSFSFGVSEDNPANMVFIAQNQPFTSGTFSFQTMIGFVANAP